MDDPVEATVARTPTVYFIDDSATMREVIKITFRRANFNVITCHDAASALAQFEQTSPDAVISDVIMPDKDGYEVCQHIKQHPQLSATPVILMSGVVNRAVAEKAKAVKADELIRKPFQPQELLARVKQLLNPGSVNAEAAEVAPAAVQALSSLFAGGAPSAASRLAAPSAASSAAAPAGVAVAQTNPRATSSPRVTSPASAEVHRLQSALLRLEHLVKKLQSELEAEREYCRALEAHIKTLQDVD